MRFIAALLCLGGLMGLARPSALGEEFFVAVGGRATGDGTLKSPWDLQTAIGPNSPVRPGATIYMRGGVYAGNFASHLTGSSDSPITLRAYGNEHVTLDGYPNPNLFPLTIEGRWAIYRNFEVVQSSTWGPNGVTPVGIQCTAPDVKIINVVVHDAGQGIGFWAGAINSEIYGCILYNNGQDAQEHGIYTQNDVGTKRIHDTLIFNNSGFGLHAYTSGSQIHGFDLQGNVVFNNGMKFGADRFPNIFVGGYPPADRLTVISNYTYMPLNDSHANVLLSDRDHSSNPNGTARVEGNYLVGGTVFTARDYRDLTFKGNKVVGGLGWLVNALPAPGVAWSQFSWDDNAYFGPGAGELLFNDGVAPRAFGDWQSVGVDAHSALSAGTPMQTDVIVRPNRYEPGRAHVIVYNWQNLDFVAVDLSGIGLMEGDRFEVRNAQNYMVNALKDYAPPLLSASYDPAHSVMMIPMKTAAALAVADPGYPGGYVPPTTLPLFGVFVVTAPSEGVPVVLTPPVAHWKFDESSGGAALDAVGSSTGTLLNGPEWVMGRLNGGLRFDGVNDVVNVPNSEVLDLDENMSISVWFQPAQRIDNHTPRRDLLKRFTSYWLIFNYPWSDGRLSFVLNGGGPAVYTTTDTWAPDQWYHVAATYGGGVMRIYVNGVLEGSITATANPIKSGYPFQIGGNTEQRFYFGGVIDEVRLYKQALEATEIEYLHQFSVRPGNDAPTISAIPDQAPAVGMEESPAEPLPGLISHWRLDEIVNGGVADEMGHNPGTTGNSPVLVAGKFGSALQFNGVNQFVNVQDSDGLDLGTRLTISLWFKPNVILDARSGRRDLLKKYIAYWLLLNYPSNDGRLSFVLNSGAPYVSSTTAEWRPDRWYHVAATYDGAALRLYVNGQLEGMVASTAVPSKNTFPLQIGGNTEQGVFCPAAFDDIRLYSEALSAQEILELSQFQAGRVNAAPTLSAVADQLADEDSAVGPLTVTVGDDATPPGSVLLMASSSNLGLVAEEGIELGGAGATRTIVLRPAANQSGSTMVTLVAVDGEGGRSTNRFTLTVRPVNDPPRVLPLADVLLRRGEVPAPIEVRVEDEETPAQLLSVRVTSDNPVLLPAGNIILDAGGVSRTLRLNPASDQSGQARVTVWIDDGQATNQVSFLWTVEGAPVAGAGAGAVSHWKLDEGAGEGLVDEAGVNPGVLRNGASRVAGRFGSAVHFDGMSQYAEMADSASLDLAKGLSLSIWFKPDQLLSASSGRKDLLAKFLSYWLILNYPAQDGRLAFVLNSGAPLVRSTNTTWEAGRWYHAMATHDGEVMKLYIDGRLEGEAPAVVSVFNTGYPLQLGGNSLQAIFFPGSLDEVMVYDRALSPTEVSTLFTAASSGAAPNTVPRMSSIADQRVEADVAGPDVPLTLQAPFEISDSETPADGLLLRAFSSNAALIPEANISFGGSGEARLLELNPAPGQIGSATITVSVTDPVGATAERTFLFTVSARGMAVDLPGLVAHWSFDESVGEVVVDSVGGLRGSLNNGPVWGSGVLGSGLRFDGQNDFVNVPDDDRFDFTTRLSVSLWFQPGRLLDRTTGRKDLFKKFISYWLILNYPAQDGRLSFVLNSGAPFVRSTRTEWEPEQWYHALGTYDGAQLKLYINGQLENTVLASASMAQTSFPVQIGGNSEQGLFFPGGIDEVCLFDRALSAAEVALLYGQAGRGLVAPAALPPGGGVGELQVEIALGADGLLLSWPAEIGRTYRLQVCSNLSASEWEDAGGDVTAEAAVGRKTVQSGTGQRFFRVLLLPELAEVIPRAAEGK